MARSSRITSCPSRARSSAVAAPAARAPTTTTSWRWRSIGICVTPGRLVRKALQWHPRRAAAGHLAPPPASLVGRGGSSVRSTGLCTEAICVAQAALPKDNACMRQHGDGIAEHLLRAGVTEREAEVLWSVAERLRNREIADRLHVSVRTVEGHIAALLRKLGLSD